MEKEATKQIVADGFNVTRTLKRQRQLIHKPPKWRFRCEQLPIAELLHFLFDSSDHSGATHRTLVTNRLLAPWTARLSCLLQRLEQNDLKNTFVDSTSDFGAFSIRSAEV